jgi:hypothetical protein
MLRLCAEDSHNTQYPDVCDVSHFFASVYKKSRQDKTSLHSRRSHCDIASWLSGAILKINVTDFDHSECLES